MKYKALFGFFVIEKIWINLKLNLSRLFYKKYSLAIISLKYCVFSIRNNIETSHTHALTIQEFHNNFRVFFRKNVLFLYYVRPAEFIDAKTR